MVDLVAKLMEISGAIMEPVCRYVNFALAAPVVAKNLPGERHHMLPRSLFPEFVSVKTAPWNIKRISAADHLVCHYMLFMAIPGNASVAYALMQMSNRIRDDVGLEPSVYAEAKRLAAKNTKAYAMGRKQSRETIQKRVEKTTGQKRTAAQRATMSASMRGIKRPPLSDSHKASISLANKGKFRSTETRARMSAAFTGVPKSKDHVLRSAMANKGRRHFIDRSGKIFRIFPNDPLVLNGSLIPFSPIAGISIRNIHTGELGNAGARDPRLSSKDWAGVNIGRKRFIDTRSGSLRFISPGDAILETGFYLPESVVRNDKKGTHNA